MKKIIILSIIILELLYSTQSFSAKAMPEYKIKAIFIYKFLFFSEWPKKAFASHESPFVIGILGNNPFGDIFNKVNKKPAGNRRLVIKHFNSGANIEALKQCHILYISSSLRGTMRKLLNSLNKYPVITVSEVNGFTQMGGIINFVKTENRVTFEINRNAATRVGIKFRSRLLKVAIRVIGD